jgi:hypothetical protein
VTGPDLKGEDFDRIFHYGAVVGKLNCLKKGSRPDISYSVHHCAHFSELPKESYAEAVMHILVGGYPIGDYKKSMLTIVIYMTGIYKRGYGSLFSTKVTGLFLPHQKLTAKNNKKIDIGLSPYEKENLLLFPAVYSNIL